MQIVIKPTGVFIGIYSDSFDYGEFGKPQIKRVSHVEPDESGRWTADMTPVDGPVLGPFDKRSEALDAEIEWLNLMMNQFDPLEEQLIL